MIKSSSFIEYFEDIPEYRQEAKVHHLLTEVLFISVAATLANAIGWAQVETFAKAREDWLRKFLTLPYGIPSHDTFERVNECIDPVQFSKCFTKWTEDISQRSAGTVIAIDGKTSRRSFDNQLQKDPIHIVNAWISSNSLILGQLKTSEKSNEITAIPVLLDMLFVEGCIITIDAIGCQKDITEKIIDKKADYVIAVKGNQPALFKDIVDWFDFAEQNEFKDFICDSAKTLDKGHGRIEKRKYYITEDIEWLDARKDWKGLKSIGMAIRESTENNKTTVERRYFISSLKADAKMFAKAVRNHWGIESTHWVLDMVFKEDENRERKNAGPENKSLLNKVVLNLLKLYPKEKYMSMVTMRYKASMDVNYLEKILFNVNMTDSV